MLKLYLAGPITGCSYRGSVNWREFVAQELKGVYECLSPMRAKEYLEGEEVIGDSYNGSNGIKQALSSQRGIMSRDYWDVQRSDVILGNFERAERVSIGTCMEFAWGFHNHTPIVCVTDDLHDHAMMREAITHPVDTISMAIQVLRALAC